MSAGSTSAWWVTSRPAIRMGMPTRKTMSAASGSAQMLNSAEAVVFPSPSEPPMSEIAADALAQARRGVQEQGDVGQRPRRDERDRLGGGAQQRPSSAPRP